MVIFITIDITYGYIYYNKYNLWLYFKTLLPKFSCEMCSFSKILKFTIAIVEIQLKLRKKYRSNIVIIVHPQYIQKCLNDCKVVKT